MRIELVYAPGCNTYKKALHVLETVIAEERLPIVIEMIEEGHRSKPAVRINGAELGEPSHKFEGDACFLSSSAGSEQLRSAINEKWMEHSIPAYA